MYSQWLKTQFDINPKKTKAGLAKELGLEPPAVSKILKGSRQVKAHEYAVMRRYFGLPLDGEVSLNSQGGYVIRPLDGAEKGFKDMEGDNGTSQWIIPSDVISRHTKAPPEKIKILEVKETLMEPDFKRGEHVVVDLTDQSPSPPGVFIVSDGFSFLLRQCEFVLQSRPPEVKISARDQSFLPHTLRREDFSIVGRVIAKVQWV